VALSILRATLVEDGYSGKENRMKKVALPLARLSFSQKLDLMETLWTDLARDEEKLFQDESGRLANVPSVEMLKKALRIISV